MVNIIIVEEEVQVDLIETEDSGGEVLFLGNKLDQLIRDSGGKAKMHAAILDWFLLHFNVFLAEVVQQVIN